MKIRFSDNNLHLRFNPLTLTRPVAELRFGILTISETWIELFKQKNINIEIFHQTESYLLDKFPDTLLADITIAANLKPDSVLLNEILNLSTDESLVENGKWIATRGDNIHKKEAQSTVLWLNNVWELFQKNDKAIAVDFDLLTKNRVSAPISSSNQVMNAEHIFLEEGATVECAILNAKNGPIYIGRNAEIMEGCMIRGGFSLGEGGVIKMGAKIYGATTIGPYSKVGGEVSNCIIQGYSNKGHDGFIGNSVIGEWCNFGADTNSSNLKNNYSNLKIHSFETNKLEQTDLTFCGVLMGDHSKTGINTMLNTATTVGVSANIFGAEFPPKFISSFSWGITEPFDFDKAINVAGTMMKRRNIELSPEDKNILKYLFDHK